METSTEVVRSTNPQRTPLVANSSSLGGGLNNTQTPPGSSQAENSGQHNNSRDRSESPVRPPVSPISPKVQPASFATPSTGYQGSYSTPTVAARRPYGPSYVPQPAPLPIDSEDNVDATALKATISMLQIQKAKAEQDIQTLRELKNAAGEEPDAFAQELLTGNLTTESRSSNPLEASLEGIGDNENDDFDSAASQFPKIPRPQEVVRCPPINWAKYHVVGNSLDKMHEEQRRRPTAGAPSSEQPRDHVVSAPYSPFVDKISNDSPTRSKGGPPR
ncbi:MAG: hypothetical protein M1831_004497 [Alyxoria varia]|nr:MAG: hypothetical protein M1831_004497 [Alyxoria varia]